MSSVEVAFKRVPITFRATPEFLKWLDTYMGIHKLDDRTAAIHKMREDLVELQEQIREVKQAAQPSSAGAGSYPLINTKLPEKAQQKIELDYLREQARQQAMLEGEQKRKIQSNSYSRQKPTIYIPEVSTSSRSCLMHWTASKCHQFPCPHRYECRNQRLNLF